MRLLYLTFQEDAPLYAGVLNKIRGQASAFQSLGFDVTYSWWKDNRFCFFGQNPQKVPINASHGVMKRFYEIAAGYLQKSRLAAGLLGILLGTLGIHNFYLGFTTRGVIQLLVSLIGGIFTCGLATIAVAIWGFIEGVLLLSASPSRMYDGRGVILRD